MESTNTSDLHTAGNTRTLVIGGCQVTINFADSSNVTALSEIRKILISSYDPDAPFIVA